MEDRNYILNRLKSKTISIDEFNYDALTAPPLVALFTPMDIANLNRIASSLRYSAKLKLKYQEIDKIMRSRGFEKFVSGTNRIAYRFIENNSFIVKVAYDSVGLNDNLAEFKNQFNLKPFCTKVFEVSPCGTVGIFERVEPITSREEYLSIASDVFELLDTWVLGEYIMEDIGSNTFMNIGIRKGFGVVLLDFSFMYKLDGNKLFCTAPSNNTPSGRCEGVIDYDAGFNFLHCTKCGVKYKARELAQAIKENNVVVKSEGEIKMKIEIKRGNKVEKIVSTGKYADLAKSTPSKDVVSVSFTAETTGGSKAFKDAIKANVSGEVKEEVKEVEVSLNNKVEDKKEKKVISPIEFDESLIKKDEPVISLEDKLRNAMSGIKRTIENEKIVDDALVFRLLVEYFGDYLHTEEDSDVKEILEDKVARLLGDDLELNINITDITYDEESNCILINAAPVIVRDNGNDEFEIVYEADYNSYGVDIDVFINIIKENNLFDGINNPDKMYEACKFVAGKVINVKDIFQKERSCKVIVGIDSNGNYITDENNSVIAIDVVDDRNLDSLAIVSADWLNSKLDENNVSEDTTETDDASKDDDTLTVYKSEDIPVGVMPVPVSVNGVPVEEEN